MAIGCPCPLKKKKQRKKGFFEVLVDIKVSVENLVRAEVEGSAGSEGRAVKKDLEEKREPEAQQEALVQLELRELRVLRVPQARQAPRVPRVSQAQQVLRAPREPRALQVQPEPPVRPALLA